MRGMTSRFVWAEVLGELALIVTAGLQPSIATADGIRIEEPRGGITVGKPTITAEMELAAVHNGRAAQR